MGDTSYTRVTMLTLPLVQIYFTYESISTLRSPYLTVIVSVNFSILMFECIHETSFIEPGPQTLLRRFISTYT